MRLMTLLAIALTLGLSSIATAEKATEGHVLKIIPAPTPVTSKPEFADCKVFQRPDGRVYSVLLGRFIRAGGTCPPEYVNGTLHGTNEIEIAKHDHLIETMHRICTLTKNGACGMVRLLDHPTIPSSTEIILRDDVPEGGKDFEVMDRQGAHVLHKAKARGFLPYIPGDWSSCMIFYTPDGTAYGSRGKTAAASGHCPSHIFAPARLIGKDEIQIANHVCKLNKIGTCVSGRIVSDTLPLVMPNDGSSWE